MSNPECLLCEGQNTDPFFRKGRYIYWKCLNCGHVFVSPLPTKSENESHYKISYTPNYLNENKAWFQVLADKRMGIVQRLYSDPANRHLLDIGSGYGFFLERARVQGWKTLGIEIAAEPLEFSRREFKLQVIAADTLEALAAIEEESFDVITLWHVLEHLEKPGEVIEEAVIRLKNGGHLIINSPNLASAIFKLVGRRWSWIYTPGHLQYFSIHPLSRWLEEMGLFIVKQETWTDAPNLFFLLQEAVLLTCSAFFEKTGVRMLDQPARRIRTFVHGRTHQQVIQEKLKALYMLVPWLDSFFRYRNLGHEFIIIARKADAGRPGGSV